MSNAGSFEIRPDAFAALDAELDLLRGIPALRIRIEGQADARGSSANNIALAWARAAAAKVWLTDRGIPPIASTQWASARGVRSVKAVSESCLWQNRRAEFVIIAGADADVPRMQ